MSDTTVYDTSQIGVLRGHAMVRAGSKPLPTIRLGILDTKEEYHGFSKRVLFCRPESRDKRSFRRFATNYTKNSQSGMFARHGLMAQALDVCPMTAPADSWTLWLSHRGYFDRRGMKFVVLDELLLRVDVKYLETYEQLPPGPIIPSHRPEAIQYQSMRSRLQEISDIMRKVNYGELHVPRKPQTKPLRFFGLYTYGRLFTLTR